MGLLNCDLKEIFNLVRSKITGFLAYNIPDTRFGTGGVLV
jgi:hypothetical protein